MNLHTNLDLTTNNVKKTYQIVKIDEKVGLGGFL